MKEDIKNAFPESRGIQHRGMTLRDYFAAKAMQGMKSSEVDGAFYSDGNLVKNAYKIADAMIEEREK